MSTIILPRKNELTDLFEHRGDPSVSIHLPSSPNPSDAPALKLAFRNAVNEAEQSLESNGADKRRIWSVVNPLRELEANEEFWREQGHGLSVLVGPEDIHVYTLPVEVQHEVKVNDRWDVGPLLRAMAQREDGYVLGVSEGTVRLYLVSAGAKPREIAVELPDDLGIVFGFANNEGDRDLLRANGATGDRIDHRKYCRTVMEAVLDRLPDPTLPMVLVAIDDFAPAYREVNTYDHLLERGVTVHPDSLSPEQYEQHAREIFDDYYRTELSDWRERFGTRRANGLATTKLPDVARAAAAAAIEDLMYDADATVPGLIDDLGALTRHDELTSENYDVLDDIAERVFCSGGRVRAVRNKDLIDGSPVAAMLRFPI